MAEYNKSGQIGNCSACMLICMLQYIMCGAVLPSLERDRPSPCDGFTFTAVDDKTESSTGWQF